MTARSSPARLCHVYQRGPHVDPQIELAKAVLDARTPLFGSCWGLQVITVATGGVRARNPKGREIGFGRRIRLTASGRGHPMYAGKDEVFNAVTVHLDEVETVSPGTQVLSSNLTSAVQSAEIRVGEAVGLGHAISSRIYARRHRGDASPLRQDIGR
jgi:GMP synthase (glutamine-hydrolysing)